MRLTEKTWLKQPCIHQLFSTPLPLLKRIFHSRALKDTNISGQRFQPKCCVKKFAYLLPSEKSCITRASAFTGWHNTVHCCNAQLIISCMETVQYKFVIYLIRDTTWIAVELRYQYGIFWVQSRTWKGAGTRGFYLLVIFATAMHRFDNTLLLISRDRKSKQISDFAP